MLKSFLRNRICLLLISFNFSCFGEITDNAFYKASRDVLAKSDYRKVNLVNLHVQRFGKSKIDDLKANAVKFLTELTDIEQKQILSEIFSKTGKFKLEKNALEDLQGLNILDSDEGKDRSLYQSIDRTQTAAGSVVLASMLTHPVSDINIIKKRQNLLKFLLENEKLCDHLNDLIKNVKEGQNSLLNYWNDEASLDENLKSLIYCTKNSRVAFLNKSIFYHRIEKIISLIRYAGTILTTPSAAMGCIVLPIVCVGSLILGDIPVSLILGSYTIANCLLFSSNISYFAYAKVMHRTIFNIHQRLRHLKKLVYSFDELFYAIRENDELRKGISLINNMCDFVTDPESLLSDLYKTKKLLSNSLFEKEKFGIFSDTGTVIAAHAHMEDAKNAFIEPLEVIGELDAYLAIVKLIKEHKKMKPSGFCFVDFIEQEKPYINLEGAWNASIGAYRAKPTNIIIGDNNPCNVIISGAIESGKSTLVQSIAICGILGRTFGIAPAKKATMSLFDAEYTFINVNRNSNSNSLGLIQERERKIKIMNYIKNNPSKKILAIIDEPYNHVMDESADILTYDLLSELSEHPNVLCIAGTKYKKSTDLADETGKFANYHLEVSENDFRDFDMTFNLIPGKCDWWFNDPVKRLKYIKFLS